MACVGMWIRSKLKPQVHYMLTEAPPRKRDSRVITHDPGSQIGLVFNLSEFLPRVWDGKAYGRGGPVGFTTSVGLIYTRIWTTATGVLNQGGVSIRVPDLK